MRRFFDNFKGQKEVGYSFWGIVATIVGTVIGIGIFFKAGNVVDATGEGWLSIVAWIFGSLIIGCLLLAYIEIASSTAKTGEVGSLSTWTKKFFNVKIAKFVGLFITMVYFPSTIVLMTSLSLDFVMSAIGPDKFGGEWGQYGFIFGMTPILLGLTFGLNLFIKNGGERWQMFGVVVKAIPFFLIIVVGIFMVITGSIDGDLDFEGSGDSATINGFFLAMPAIIFSFDGFIYAANLQNEMKQSDRKRFPKAIILSLAIIALIYIGLAIMLVWIGDKNSGFSIPEVLMKMFGNHSWLFSLTMLVIAISGLTCMNGFSMMSMQAYKSLSEEDMIPDKNKKYLRQDRNRIPRKSTHAMMWTIVVVFFIFLAGETIAYLISPAGEYRWLDLVNQIGESGVVVTSVIYSLVVIGALWNRKTGRTPVDKMKGFIPLALIGSIGMLFASTYNLANLIMQSIDGNITSALTLSIIVVQFSIIIVVYFSTSYYTYKKNKPKEIKFRI